MDELEVTTAAYDAWNAGDIAPALVHMHPDVEWRSSGVFPGIRGVYRGHEGVLRWREDLAAPFERFVVEILDLQHEGDLVTARVRFVAVGAASGAPVQLHFVNRWHFRDGLIVSFDSRPLD